MKDRTKWKPNQIVNLLNICIEETHFFDYRGNIWTQTDGLAIGKSTSGALTDIFMNWYEREYIFNPSRNKFIPFCWERQKDDVYCLWQFGERNHDKFLKYLNGNERRIQWTKEMEKDRMLPIFGYEDDESKKQDTDWDLQETEPHSQVLRYTTHTDQEINKLGF